MKLHELSSVSDKNKRRKRLGRGNGSGLGTTSGRGHKGHNSRSGGGVRIGFEGGQMPIYRRLPKRGFINIFKNKYKLVFIRDLNKFNSGDVVDRNLLIKNGVLKSKPSLLKMKIKLLGNGELKKGLIVKIDKISKSAKRKIETAGGRIEGIV